MSCWISDNIPLLCLKGQFPLECLELLPHFCCIFLVYLLKLFVFELEEHDFEHLLLALVAGALAVLEGAQGRNHDLLADCLEDRLAFEVVGVLDEVRHPSI